MKYHAISTKSDPDCNFVPSGAASPQIICSMAPLSARFLNAAPVPVKFRVRAVEGLEVLAS